VFGVIMACLAAKTYWAPRPNPTLPAITIIEQLDNSPQNFNGNMKFGLPDFIYPKAERQKWQFLFSV
jgi:hypothetical protein